MVDGCLDRILDPLLVCLFTFEIYIALANLVDVTAVLAVRFTVIATDSQVVEVITIGARSGDMDETIPTCMEGTHVEIEGTCFSADLGFSRYVE